MKMEKYYVLRKNEYYISGIMTDENDKLVNFAVDTEYRKLYSDYELAHLSNHYKYYPIITCNIDKVVVDNIEYKGFFISMAKVDNLIIETFEKSNPGTVTTLNVLEADLLIHPLNKCTVKYYNATYFFLKKTCLY